MVDTIVGCLMVAWTIALVASAGEFLYKEVRNARK